MNRHIYARWLPALASFFLLSQASWADLTAFGQDFEGLDQSSPTALGDNGWLVFGNVFDLGGGYLYGYGPDPAPNGGAAFSAVANGEGGPDQGAQQLSVYNDYNNGDHSCCLIEANVYQEQTIGAADLGNTWTFSFEAKKGNIELASTAFAFIKVLDQVGGTFALLAFPTIEMTSTPETWTGYQISLEIDPAWEGQLLQFGALSNATNFEGSGIFYDNVNFAVETGPSVGGSVDGIFGFLGQCTNETTGQVVQISLGGSSSWDCEAAGLLVSPGDTILQFGAGPVNSPGSQTGAITGLSGIFGACRNLSTGQISPVPLGGGTNWDCTNAGFIASPGEIVIHISRGTVPTVNN